MQNSQTDIGSSYAILLAGGSGSRMRGAVRDKCLEILAGLPVIAHSARAFLESGTVAGFVVVHRDDAQRVEIEKAFALLDGLRGPGAPGVLWARGGAERQDSVLAGLEACPPGAALAFIHDTARPLIHPETIRALAAAAAAHGAAVAAHRVSDTIKRLPAGAVPGAPAALEDLDRSTLWGMETPQVFRLPLILDALREVARLGLRVTDDVAAATRAGHGVALVESLHPNPKLTTPGDLPLLAHLLAARAGAGSVGNADAPSAPDADARAPVSEAKAGRRRAGRGKREIAAGRSSKPGASGGAKRPLRIQPRAAGAHSAGVDILSASNRATVASSLSPPLNIPASASAGGAGARAKLCGVTRRTDARVGVALGFAYLGINLWEGSPRWVPWDSIPDLFKIIPPGRRVCVDVAPDDGTLERAFALGFDIAQIHFDPATPGIRERAARWSAIAGPARLWLAPRLAPGTPWVDWAAEFADTFLFDAYKAGTFGGTGLSADLERFADLRRRYPEKRWVLAGGLGPETLPAVRHVAPDLFDLNSGVESCPGMKSLKKLRLALAALA